MKLFIDRANETEKLLASVYVDDHDARIKISPSVGDRIINEISASSVIPYLAYYEHYEFDSENSRLRIHSERNITQELEPHRYSIQDPIRVDWNTKSFSEIRRSRLGVDDNFIMYFLGIYYSMEVGKPSKVSLLSSPTTRLNKGHSVRCLIRNYKVQMALIDILDYKRIYIDPNSVDQFRFIKKLNVGKDNLEEWSDRMTISANRVSFWLYDSSVKTTGFRIELDAIEHIIRVEEPSGSAYTIDLRESIMYHKNGHELPLDMSLVGTHQISAPVRRGACSLIDISNLKPSSDSKLMWRYLVGTPSTMMYVGRTRFFNARLAHEFWLNYDIMNASLPIISRIMGYNKFGRNSNILIKMFVEVSEKCKDLHDEGSVCINELGPIILGFELEDGSQLTLHDFKWQHSNFIDREVFDISDCPADQANLELTIRWNDLKLDRMCKKSDDIDDIVHMTLANLVMKYAPKDIKVSNVARVSKFTLGIDNQLIYNIELVKTPNDAFKYELIEDANEDPEESQLVFEDGKVGMSLLECFGQASRFDWPHVSVSHSRKTLECRVYKSLNLKNSPKKEKDSFIQRYKRIVVKRKENLTPDLRMFLHENIDKIVNDLSGLRSFQSCCIDELYSVDGIKFGLLEIHSNSERDSIKNQRSTSEDTKMVTLENQGYKTREGETKEYSAVTMVECSAKCQRSPSCSSFSHCRRDGKQTCVLSKIKLDYHEHNTFTSEQVYFDNDCTIRSKDFMRYFDANRSVKVEQVNLNLGNWTSEHFESDQSCAYACYKSKNCDKFLFCQRNDPQSSRSPNCHRFSLKPGLVDTNKLNSDEISADQSQPHSCILYERKPTSFYEPHKVGHKNWSKLGLPSVTLRHVNIDQCAIACQKDPDCHSLDFCSIRQKVNEDGSNDQIGLRHDCVLISGSIGSGNNPQLAITDEPIDPNVICTHYEPIQDNGGDENRVKPRPEARAQAIKSSPSLVSFPSILAVLLNGIALGIYLNDLRRAKREQESEAYRDEDQRDELCADCGDMLASCAL